MRLKSRLRAKLAIQMNTHLKFLEPRLQASLTVQPVQLSECNADAAQAEFMLKRREQSKGLSV